MGGLPVGLMLGGTYRIERVVADGGMSVVHEATHMRLPGRYAIKILQQQLWHGPEAVARFRREARTTSLLRHPNIVEVVDFDVTDDGVSYIVMEYLEGRSLGDLIYGSGSLSPPRAAGLIAQMAAGLAAAHERGVIHRDLKPSNVLVSSLPDGNELVKIVDFGISMVRDATTELTAKDVVLGTPRYMAPEQLLGRADEIGPATDQFALAAIAYELLTGRRAFPAEQLDALGYQILYHAPQPLEGAYGRCEAVISKGLAKRGADRYDSVGSFAAAFRAAAVGLTIGPPSGSIGMTGRAGQPTLLSSPSDLASSASSLDANLTAARSVPATVLIGSHLAAAQETRLQTRWRFTGRRQWILMVVLTLGMGSVAAILVHKWRRTNQPGSAALDTPGAVTAPVTAAERTLLEAANLRVSAEIRQKLAALYQEARGAPAPDALGEVALANDLVKELRLEHLVILGSADPGSDASHLIAAGVPPTAAKAMYIFQARVERLLQELAKSLPPERARSLAGTMNPTTHLNSSLGIASPAFFELPRLPTEGGRLPAREEYKKPDR